MAGYPTARRNQILAEVGGVLTADYTAAIGLVVDPPVTGWRKHLGYTTAIEYYVRAAAACCASDAAAPDLLDAVVAVGKAHTFAGLLHPDVVAAPVAALTPEQETAQWERMQPLLADIDWQQITAYVGSWHRAGVPKWSGHTIGYHIVQRWLERHPEATLSDWMELPAEVMLAESGYDPGDPPA